MAYVINELLKRLVRTRTVGYLFLDRNMSWLLMLLTSPVVGWQIPTDCCLVWSCLVLPSVLWRCWLGGRKGIRPVKTERWGAGMVICLERGADLHMTQLMPLPLTVSCFSEIQISFTFLVPRYPGSPGQRAVKRCVCVCVCVCCLIWCCQATVTWRRQGSTPPRRRRRPCLRSLVGLYQQHSAWPRPRGQSYQSNKAIVGGLAAAWSMLAYSVQVKQASSRHVDI